MTGWRTSERTRIVTAEQQPQACGTAPLRPGCNNLLFNGLTPRANSSVWSRAPALQASYVSTFVCLTYIVFADLLASLANPSCAD
jgi:hypothetical protein